MKFFTAVMLFGAVCAAQTPTAPPQPATGPGGSNTAYSAVATFGPYNDSADNSPAYNYYIYEPASPTPAQAPVILFLHGYGADEPLSYQLWINQLAQNGYTVVWVQYDTNVGAAAFAPIILNTFQGALTRISGGRGFVTPALDASGQVETAVVGHSAGAFDAFTLADWSSDPAKGIPPFHAVVAIEPGQGQIPAYDLSNVNPNTRVVLVVGDQDKAKRHCQAATIWNSLSQIPAANKDFLELISDGRGTPQQVGNHYFSLTWTEKDTLPPPPPATVDDRDYNVSWKLSVGMMNCVFRGEQCDFALGHGSANQVGMGNWSNGHPVNPLLLVQDPPTYFKLDCANSQNDPDPDEM